MPSVRADSVPTRAAMRLHAEGALGRPWGASIAMPEKSQPMAGASALVAFSRQRKSPKRCGVDSRIQELGRPLSQCVSHRCSSCLRHDMRYGVWLGGREEHNNMIDMCAYALGGHLCVELDGWWDSNDWRRVCSCMR